MSEKESEPLAQPESGKVDTQERLQELLARIRENAIARAPEVEVPDTRALEAEDNLAGVGETWLRQEIAHTKHLHYVRLGLLGALFILVILWLISIGMLLLLSGFGSLVSFQLSDKVIMTYMGTTTVSVLGLFHIAAKWLFSAGFADFAKSFAEVQSKVSSHKK
jgi:hypothetical protein